MAGFTKQQLAVNPHIGSLVDEVNVRAVVGNKIYWASNRAQGASNALGYEYLLVGGNVSEIGSYPGSAHWMSVYDSAAGIIYAVGQVWQTDASQYRSSVTTIDTSDDTMTVTLMNATGKATGECNELIGVWDDGTQLVAGEVAPGGNTAGSDYPNSSGLWTIPKATVTDASTYTRVYEDPQHYEWRNIVKLGSYYYGCLGEWGHSKFKLVSSTDLASWTTEVDGTANWLGDRRPSMCVSTALGKVFAAFVVSDTVRIYAGTHAAGWTALETGLPVNSDEAPGVPTLALFTIGTNLYLTIGGHAYIYDGRHHMYRINTTTGAPTTIQRDIVGAYSMNQIVVGLSYVIYGTQAPGYLYKVWPEVASSPGGEGPPITVVIPVVLGSSQTGLALTAAYIDPLGNPQEGLTTENVYEIGLGNYVATHTLPDPPPTGAVVYSAGGVIKAVAGINAAELATPSRDAAIADALLTRDWTEVSGEADRSLLNAARFLRNKWVLSGSTLTVAKEDDTTAAWTAAVTTNAAGQPVVGADPEGP